MNRAAIVTGGGRGIGRACAERLLAEGYRVAIGQRGTAELEATRAALAERFSAGPDRLRALANLDVRNANQVESLFDVAARFLGPVQVVVNAAGISRHARLLETASDAAASADAVWHDVIKTNLTGAYHVTCAAARIIPDASDGRIIHIGSVLGKFGVPGKAAYCASKHGLIGLVRAAMHELAPRGITANCVCPGWVETEMSAKSIRDEASESGVSFEEAKRRAIDEIPARRFLDPGEVADLVVFLASPAARGITGQALSICNGTTAF